MTSQAVTIDVERFERELKLHFSDGCAGIPLPGRVLTHARDLPDLVLLNFLGELQQSDYGGWGRVPHWVSQWDLATLLCLNGYTAADRRVEGLNCLVVAKARRLIDRKLITGCPCGCRGDFELTDTGLAAIEEATQCPLSASRSSN